MSGKTTMSMERRRAICPDDGCEEHAGGDNECPVPLFEEDLEDALGGDKNAGSGLGSAKPKTATASVVRGDE